MKTDRTAYQSWRFRRSRKHTSRSGHQSCCLGNRSKYHGCRTSCCGCCTGTACMRPRHRMRRSRRSRAGTFRIGTQLCCACSPDTSHRRHTQSCGCCRRIPAGPEQRFRVSSERFPPKPVLLTFVSLQSSAVPAVASPSKPAKHFSQRSPPVLSAQSRQRPSRSHTLLWLLHAHG